MSTVRGMPDNFTAPADTQGITRSQKIAAIHAFADFLAEHPELPMPTVVHCSATIADIRPGETASQAAERWADTHGVDKGAIFESQYTVSVTLPVATREAHGIQIGYSGHVHRSGAERPL